MRRSRRMSVTVRRGHKVSANSEAASAGTGGNGPAILRQGSVPLTPLEKQDTHMCGRYTFQPTEAFYRRFNLTNRLDGLVARDNIAPGQMVPVIIVDGNPSCKMGRLRLGAPIEDWLYVSRQPFKPRLGVPHVCRVKPLDEPAVDRREQVGGFGSRALLRPQVIEADGSLPLQ
jgi:hypothetical protein